MSDPIMNLHYQGLNSREISQRTGKTRASIIGYIHRYKERGNQPAKPRNVVDIARIEAAISEHGGDVTRAAHFLGLHPSTLRVRGYLTGRALVNRATDPETRATVGLMIASGLDLIDIAEGSGVGVRTLGNWRNGHHKGQPFLLACVREYVQKNTPGY